MLCMKSKNKFKLDKKAIKKFRKCYANGGREALEESMIRADKAVEYYRKAREPDWSTIHEPMTI